MSDYTERTHGRFIDANALYSTDDFQDDYKERIRNLEAALTHIRAWQLNAEYNLPRNGKWIKLDIYKGMAQYKCSVCGAENYVPECMGEPIYEYCPCCGAKMGGPNP